MNLVLLHGQMDSVKVKCIWEGTQSLSATNNNNSSIVS